LKPLLRLFITFSAIFFKENVSEETFQNTFTAIKIVKIIFTIVVAGFFIYFYIMFKEYENRDPSVETSSIGGPISL
jgi:heme/copper-type cytochrome/quinol oxidase subunit 2